MSIIQIAHFEVNTKRVLGEGGFGKVYRAKDTSEDPPMECAAKQMRLTADAKAALEREVELMRTVGDHPSIINFRHYEQAGDHSWIFMEMATGGELFDRLIDSGNLTERAVAPYFKGMTDGLLHCHQRGVVHRDIKLENVMLCAEDPHAVKLVDFGLAMPMPKKADGSFDAKVRFHDRVGSKSYRAPEILAANGYEGPPVDVWALGITVFSLVSGFFPLDEARPKDWRFDKLQKDQNKGVGSCDSIYSMYKRVCPFSPELKELLNAMLSIDVNKRATMQQIADHPWFTTKTGKGGAMYDDDGDEVMYRSAGGDDEPAAAYLNLSLCFLKTQQWQHAVNTATRAIQGDKDPVDPKEDVLEPAKKAKALFRRAMAESEGFTNWDNAVRDLRSSLELVPDDKAIQNELKKAEQALKKASKAADQKMAGFFNKSSKVQSGEGIFNEAERERAPATEPSKEPVKLSDGLFMVPKEREDQIVSKSGGSGNEGDVNYEELSTQLMCLKEDDPEQYAALKNRIGTLLEEEAAQKDAEKGEAVPAEEPAALPPS